MKILLIKPRHIGDSLIMTPTIQAIRRHYPDCTLWAVVRSSCDAILAGCPGIDRIITTARPESNRRKFSTWLKDLRTLKEIRNENFDYAIDLGESVRGRWITFLSGAKYRVSSYSSGNPTFFWKKLIHTILDFTNYAGHRVIKDFETVSSVLDIGKEIPPLVFEKNLSIPTDIIPVSSSFVIVHPGTRWKRKQWPVEKWIELCNHLKTKHEHVLISTGKDEVELSLAREIRSHCGDRIILTEGTLSWAQSAHLLYRAKAFIGVDTAMSHLSAACQCPSVVIFGATYEGAWGPWKSPHRIILPPGCKELHEGLAPQEIWSYGQRKTAEVSVSDVISAYEEMVSLQRSI